MFQLIAALVIKEFLALVRDKRSRFVLIGPPIAQLLVFGYAATFDLNDVPVALYDQDGGAAAHALIDHVAGSPHFRIVQTVRRDADIGPLIDEQVVSLVLSIPQNFTADLLKESQPRIQGLVDGRNSNTALIALNYMNDILFRFNRDWAAEHLARTVPVTLTMRTWYNENLTSRWFFVPGIVALLTLVMTLIVTALSVAREREAGTFDQLLVTPLQPWQILLGKSLPGLIIGLLEATMAILVAHFWFEIPLRGDLSALYLGLVLFVLSAVGMGMMISSIAVTQQQAVLGAFLVLVPSVILSGFATPVANMPEFLQWISFLDPLRFCLIVVRAVFLEGAGVDALWNQFWPMLIIGVVTLTIAGGLFRRRLY